jgi:ABC-2 type transport system ATP-binding protein
VLIQTEQLSKRYGQLAALSDCSFEVPQGEILGLLGPNGAGKTTLLRLLLGYLKPTSGAARIDGLDCYRQSLAVHRRLAYLPGDARLFRQLNGRQTLDFFARLRHASLERSLQLAERLQLDLTRRVRQMSTGMRQKLALAVTLTPDVPLVILDEPTANLDPTVRRDVVDLIRQARSEGKTILFSSHVLSEVEEACDRVVVLKAGRLVDAVRVADVRRQHRIRAALAGSLSPLPAALAESVELYPPTADGVTIIARGELAPLLGWLAQQPLAELQIEPIGLSSVYHRHHPAMGDDQ